MNAQVPTEPRLTVDLDHSDPGWSGVGVHALDPRLMLHLGQLLQRSGQLDSVLRVEVVPIGGVVGGDLPDLAGHHLIVENELRFMPHFPLQHGITYRASFDPRPLGLREHSKEFTLEFMLPDQEEGPLTEVQQIFPSSAELPENLLRFYVFFSNPMRRGHTITEVSILGAGNQPAPEILYRAPVELWDRDMQCLTILLDPGRLKRGVGPNRELGPPLMFGQDYTLVIGRGMTDLSGRRMARPVHKRFRVSEAIREPIALEQWKLILPAATTRDVLTLAFPTPLDWALLSSSLEVTSPSKQPVAGRVAIDDVERRWSFTPELAWSEGSYCVRVAPDLEDVCGNGVDAAFDRAIRPSSQLDGDSAARSIVFQLT